MFFLLIYDVEYMYIALGNKYMTVYVKISEYKVKECEYIIARGRAV